MTMTPQIGLIKEAVARRFSNGIDEGRLRITGGVFNCRAMRPRPRSATPGIIAYSEHAWGNAWDLHWDESAGRSEIRVRRVVGWLRRQDAEGNLPVGSILTYKWERTHVHIEGAPKRNPRPFVNIPPCISSSSTTPPEEDRTMISSIQTSLNSAGFHDINGRTLRVDGIWGPLTSSAFDLMVSAVREPASGSGSIDGISPGDAVTIVGILRRP